MLQRSALGLAAVAAAAALIATGCTQLSLRRQRAD
jgi:hypothetical protein